MAKQEIQVYKALLLRAVHLSCKHFYFRLVSGWSLPSRVLQTAAKAALELHNQELEPGRALSVLISNPERKQERTDSDANDRELYVAGLSRAVKREDLKKLFNTVRDYKL